MSVSYECRVLSAMGQSLVQSSPTKCACVSLSVIKCNNVSHHHHVQEGLGVFPVPRSSK